MTLNLKFNFGLLIFVLVIMYQTFPDYSVSQELEPRAYSNLPINFNFAALNYTYTTGNIITDPASPIKDLDINSNNVISGYARSFSMFGRLSRIQVLLPYTFLSGNAKLSGKDTSGTRSGFSDARIRIGINIIGSPAMTVKEFVNFKESMVIGASLVVSIPTGQYFPERLINLGTNRWGFKPEIGISRKFSKFYVEIYTGVWFFTANNEYLNSKKLTTDPLFTVQSHVNYVFDNKMWIGVNGGYAYGGLPKIDGAESGLDQNNYRLGLTFSTPLSSHFSLKLQYHTGAVVTAGSDFDFYGATVQYSWF